MTEEILKNKYKNLEYQLKIVKEQLQDIVNSYNDLDNAIKECLLVDDKKVDDSIFFYANKETSSILSELTTNIIPIVASKK